MLMHHMRLRSSALALFLFAVPQTALAINKDALAFNSIYCDGSGTSGTIQFVGRPEGGLLRWTWLGNIFYLAAIDKNGDADNSHGQAMMIEDYITSPRVKWSGMPEAQGVARQAFLDLSHNIIKQCLKKIGKSVEEFQRSLR